MTEKKQTKIPHASLYETKIDVIFLTILIYNKG